MSRVISDSLPGNPAATPEKRLAPSRIRDPIGRTLIVLFAIKPFIDLFWGFGISIGPIRLSPLTVTGFFVVAYFAAFRLKLAQYAPPFARIFEAFIVLNLITVVIGLATSPDVRLALALDIMVRILGCYLVFFCTYAAARRYQYTEAKPFMKAIVIGTAIAVVVNFVAIKVGYGGAKVGTEFTSGASREAGLYYDPGTLGLVAFLNLTFTVFYFHVTKRGKALWLMVTLAFAMMDLFLMAASESRTPLVLLAIAAMGYLWFLRGWGRVAAPLIVALVLLMVAAVFSVQTDKFFGRFEGDVATIESGDSAIGQSSSGEVSLGKYEALGNNRGALWADAITVIARRPAGEILFGNFFGRIGAHSDYIDILARNGIVGLGLYVLLIYGLALKIFGLARSATREDHRTLQSLATILLVCYAAYCFPFRPLGYTTTNWFMWSMAALALAAVPRVSRRSTPTIASSSGSTTSGPSTSLSPSSGPSPGSGPTPNPGRGSIPGGAGRTVPPRRS